MKHFSTITLNLLKKIKYGLVFEVWKVSIYAVLAIPLNIIANCIIIIIIITSATELEIIKKNWKAMPETLRKQ